MKKNFFGSIFLAIIFSACHSDKLKLSLNPAEKKPLKISYVFSVNSPSTGNLTTFNLELSGSLDKDGKGNAVLETKNEHITLEASIQGKTVKAVAGGADTLPAEVRMVAAPVFNLLGKQFKTVYDNQLNRLSESMVSETLSADSAENRVQFFIQYPYEELKPGSVWEKELVIRSGNKINCSAHFTLDSLTGGKAVVSITGKLTGKGQSFGHEFGIAGTLNGKIKVDTLTGLPVEGEVKQVFSLDLNGQKIPIESFTKYKVTF